MSNKEKARKNGLWVGKEVWDCSKSGRGIVESIAEGHCTLPVEVRFDSGKSSYTLDRRWCPSHPPTLSDAPYEIHITVNRDRPNWEPKPGEVVLVRDSDEERWIADIYEEFCAENYAHKYKTFYSHWAQCRPFDVNLIGKTDNYE